MSKNKKIDLLDYFILLVNYKKVIISIVFLSMVVFYLLIYFFVDEQFDASATIIPVEENSLAGIAGMLKDFPVDIAGAGIQNTEFARYTTIIYSRSVLDKVINKFNLVKAFQVDRTDKAYYEKTLEILRGNISASEDENGAYIIEVRDTNPERAAKITNYLIELLNDKIVELKIQKSTENRKFLEARLFEIQEDLRNAEDTLKNFQERTGLLSAEDQIEQILKANAELETRLITKQIELSILKEIRNPDSPELQNLITQVNEIEKKVNSIKKTGQPNSYLLGINSLPEKAINYYRLLRQVEINNSILEFVVPLYEQARFEEQKEVPILQVVDYAIPPAEKSYPPRTIFTLLFGTFTFFLIFVLILLRESSSLNKSEKVKYIKNNLLKWKNT